MTIDWKNAPEGATHYTIKESGVIWFKDANSFWSIWDSGKWEAIGLPACKLIPRPTSTAIPEPKQLTQAVADAAEIERLDQCIGELRLELSKCQERNDELCIANHNQTVKISKIRKVINEN